MASLLLFPGKIKQLSGLQSIWGILQKTVTFCKEADEFANLANIVWDENLPVLLRRQKLSMAD